MFIVLSKKKYSFGICAFIYQLLPLTQLKHYPVCVARRLRRSL